MPEWFMHSLIAVCPHNHDHNSQVTEETRLNHLLEQGTPSGRRVTIHANIRILPARPVTSRYHTHYEPSRISAPQPRGYTEVGVVTDDQPCPMLSHIRWIGVSNGEPYPTESRIRVIIPICVPRPPH